MIKISSLISFLMNMQAHFFFWEIKKSVNIYLQQQNEINTFTEFKMKKDENLQGESE